jgi:hypothetical protein
LTPDPKAIAVLTPDREEKPIIVTLTTKAVRFLMLDEKGL